MSTSLMLTEQSGVREGRQGTACVASTFVAVGVREGRRGTACVASTLATVTHIYVYNTVLNTISLIPLKTNSQQAPYYELLNLFAYGVYGDYVRESSKFPDLSPVMLTKLRHLTMVSLATGQKSIPLITLGNQLGITNNRELEDLIIEAIYAAYPIIKRKYEQQECIYVDYAIGRDIKPEDQPNIIATLQSWCDTCDTMLANIDQLITHANQEKEKHNKHRNSLEQEVLNIKASLKTQAAEGDETLVSDSRDHDKKRPNTQPRKGIRGSSSKFWPKTS
ncbi:unnamed protein product, partial [Meganyctiphanes norvegica]